MRKIRKITSLELSDMVSIINVPSLAKLVELQQAKDWLLESDDSYFLLKTRVCLRSWKKNARPKTIKILGFEVHPDYPLRVKISSEDLFDFALKHNISLFEAPDTYVLPGDGLMMVAEKKDVKT